MSKRRVDPFVPPSPLDETEGEILALVAAGRQRGYLLHFTAAKQSKTRTARIEKCIPAILAGKGMHDR